MNGIIGMSNLLLDTNLNSKQREYCETISNSADALLTIINDILDFTRVESGRLELEAHPFDLRNCVEEVLDLVAIDAARKELDLLYLIEPGTPEWLIGDPTRLRQIVLNLLNNAVKFTAEGEVVLLVGGTSPADASDTCNLTVSVRDTGIGIPKDRMDRLFQSFTQVDASTTRRFGGTGLGLAISQRLVRLMGGEISVESEEKKGTQFRFTITLPLARDVTPRQFHETIPQIAGKRLLLVDDNETNLHILRTQTEAWSMVPVATTSPDEALGWLRDGQKFDAAILDMSMPDIDGLSLAQAIREIHGPDRLPLLLLSSLGGLSEEDSARAEKVQFAALLTKPTKRSHLLDMLLTTFEGRTVRVVSDTARKKSPFDHGMADRLPMRILLADDHPTNLKLGLMILERLGYKADVAGNGKEVLHALEQAEYDLILMDIEMPEMDGQEATRAIRARWGDAGPKIIAMTANAIHGDRDRYLADGMDDYISKPIEIRALVKAMERCAPAGSDARTVTPPEATAAADAAESTRAHAQDPVELDQQAIDRLLEIIGGDREAFAELVQSFLDEAPGLLDRLTEAAAAGDSEEVRRAAHTMKSSSRDFGATTLAELCMNLEERGRSGDIADAAAAAQQIRNEYAKAEAALHRMLE